MQTKLNLNLIFFYDIHVQHETQKTLALEDDSLDSSKPM